MLLTFFSIRYSCHLVKIWNVRCFTPSKTVLKTTFNPSRFIQNSPTDIAQIILHVTATQWHCLRTFTSHVVMIKRCRTLSTEDIKAAFCRIKRRCQSSIRKKQLKLYNGYEQLWPAERAWRLCFTQDSTSSDCRSALRKQSLNRNVTEEIIAISNDNTQF